jgi:O-antigen/teichoic acid export membrane protein
MSATPEMARMARGAAWSAAGTVTAQALAVLSTVLAARALPPDAFGIAGMALVVTTLLAAVRDLGMGPAIASGRVTDERTLFAANGILWVAGAAGMGVLLAVAPLVARFFGDELVTPVLRVQAVALLLGSAVAVPQAMLQRAGRFATLAVLAAASQAIAAAGVAIGVALHAGVWTLIVPGVVAAAAMVPLHWIALRRAPRWVFSVTRVADLLREGRRISGAALCTYVIRNSDNAILGRLSGARSLGLYAFAYNFLTQPLGLFSHALMPVLLPAFGRLEDRSSRSDGVVRVALALLRTGAPVMVGGALTAPVFVPMLFGAQWREAVPIVQILMVTGALQIPGPVFGTLCLTIGDASFVLRWSAAHALAAPALYLAGALAGGPVGVAVACAVYTIGALLLMYLVARRRFGLALSGLVTGAAGVARDLAIMAAFVIAAGALAGGLGLGSGGRLALEVVAGALAYATAVRILAREEAAVLVSLLPGRVGRAGARMLGLSRPAA